MCTCLSSRSQPFTFQLSGEEIIFSFIFSFLVLFVLFQFCFFSHTPSNYLQERTIWSAGSIQSFIEKSANTFKSPLTWSPSSTRPKWDSQSLPSTLCEGGLSVPDHCDWEPDVFLEKFRKFRSKKLHCRFCLFQNFVREVSVFQITVTENQLIQVER